VSQSTVSGALDEATRKMKSAVSVLREELAAIRTGRATPALLSRVTFDYYGTQQPIKDMASMSVPEPRLLVIQPFDRAAISAMEKAILSSDLGITPSNDGNVIRLAFPPLTEERRRDLIKMVHQRAEEARVAVRNVRRHSKEEIEKLEHDHSISEDELRRAEKELQKLTDQFVAEVDEAAAHKERELLEV
jgi:ribosome recycling factor